ncbi:Pycsar system effector family protein [Halalkalibaculum sp. DA3122]|uniref:Pycsar system effector family protein n=1 Tax=Halalkalibaculum sp. DA3122 TaxID=3373607 RepID=UPI0037540D1B
MAQDLKSHSDSLKFIINRYDSYYSGINFKARFYTGLATFIITAFIYKVEYLTNSISIKCWLYIQYGLISVTLALCFFILFKLTSSVMPYLEIGKENGIKDHSLIFFEEVADYQSAKQYKEALSKDEYDINTDLANQAYLLAQGLSKKFKKLKHATHALYATGVTVILVLIIKLISLS